MKKQEVLERLCALCTLVADQKYDHKIPADCFCGIRSESFFDFHPEILAFIENAITEKLKGERGKK